MAITFYATNNFTGNGSTTTWNINFADGYISPADVKARYVNAAGDFEDIAITSVSGNVVTISPAQPNGRVFQIYRDTQKSSPLVDFADGAILNETNLDTMARQAVMVAAESADLSNYLSTLVLDTVGVADDALTIAQNAATAATAAVATANDAADDANNAVAVAASAASTAASASSAASSAVSTANAASSAASAAVSLAEEAQEDVDAAVSAANNAVTIAQSSVDNANTALSQSTTALSQSTAALSAANSAVTVSGEAADDAAEALTTANGIDAKAQTALDNSAAAVTTANAAETTANGIAGTAADALTTAQGALDTASDALDTAEAAETTANGIDAKATQALDDSAMALSQSTAAVSAVNAALSAVASKADLDSPEFTGTPTAPTPASNDDSTAIATTEFVQDALAGFQGGIGSIRYRAFISGTTITLDPEVKMLLVDALAGGSGGGGYNTAPAAGTIRIYPPGNHGGHVKFMIDLEAAGLVGATVTISIGMGSSGAIGTTAAGGNTLISFGDGSKYILVQGGAGVQGQQYQEISSFPGSVRFTLSAASGSYNGFPAGSVSGAISGHDGLPGNVIVSWDKATDTSSSVSYMDGANTEYGQCPPYCSVGQILATRGYGAGGAPGAANSSYSSTRGGDGGYGYVVLTEYR